MPSIDYLGAVGALMYLATFSRPDIAYAVDVLARFNAYPGLAHWNAVKHLFHYLKGTAHFALTYAPDPSSSGLFTTFSDADHGGCKDSGRSTGAYVVKMGTGAFPGAPSFGDLLPNGPVRQSTLLQWKLARKLFGCAISLRRWASLSVPLPCCTLSTSLPFR